MKVDLRRFLEDHDAEIVVLSRDRASALAERTDKVLNGYHLFYSGEGYDDYDYNCVDRTKVPRGLQGLSVVRNFVLDTLKQKVIVFVDDDLKALYYVAGARSVRLDTEQVSLAFINLIVHALDQGATAFGMSELDIRKTSPFTPFIQRAVFGSVFGVVGRKHRFDERNLLKCDYDFCLQVMRDNRTVHKDLRYMVACAKDSGSGGNMTFRTPGRRQEEIDRLKRWWGDDVIYTGVGKVVEKLTVKVP
jgi:hypothetical protein